MNRKPDCYVNVYRNKGLPGRLLTGNVNDTAEEADDIASAVKVFGCTLALRLLVYLKPRLPHVHDTPPGLAV